MEAFTPRFEPSSPPIFRRQELLHLPLWRVDIQRQPDHQHNMDYVNAVAESRILQVGP